MTDLQHSPHRIGHHSPVKLLHAQPLVQISTKPEPIQIVHGALQYAMAIFTPPKQSSQRV
jgi:hypothetical protein